jgi:hypothetical protein
MVPEKIRKSLNIGPDTTIEWIIEGGSARVIPVPADPIRAFRGSGKRGIVQQLIKARRREW